MLRQLIIKKYYLVNKKELGKMRNFLQKGKSRKIMR
jgi:hypothetical protein